MTVKLTEIDLLPQNLKQHPRRPSRTQAHDRSQEKRAVTPRRPAPDSPQCSDGQERRFKKCQRKRRLRVME